MNLLRFRSVAALAVSCLLFALGGDHAFAGKQVKEPPPPDMRKMIKSVDAKNSAVVIIYMNNKQTHTYRVDDMTALKVNGVAGKFADIKAGMEVADYAERDNDDLDSLTLTGYPEEPKPAAKPKAKPAPKPKPAPASTP